MFNHNKLKKTYIGLCLIFIHLLFSQWAFAETKEYRLPKSTIPLSQYIEMQLDPNKEGYSGSTVIDIKVTKPTNRIGIHWLDLNVESITLKHKKNHNIRFKVKN